MTLALESPPLPLEVDAHGSIRVGKTRVTLDTLVAAYREGATPEEILQRYPTLELSDVYTVIAYYLRHQVQVDSYLQQRQSDAQALRESIERQFDPHGVRERLMARRSPESLDQAP